MSNRVDIEPTSIRGECGRHYRVLHVGDEVIVDAPPSRRPAGEQTVILLQLGR
jgi:hypothetical protein